MDEFPDEILRRMFTYLPIKERLRLEQVCKRWSILMPYNVSKLDLVETFIPVESLRKADTFPLTNVLCSLLKRCGHHLLEISFGKVYLLITFVVIDRIDEYCPNLKSLNLSYCTVTESIVPSLIELSDRLINLNLSNTIFSIRNIDQHKDNMAILFSHLDRLENINLQKTNVHNLTAVYFLPPSLKCLNLNSCSPLRVDVLIDLLMRCTKLEDLRLSAYTKLDQFVLETICSLKNLKILELSHMAFGEIVLHTNQDEPFDLSVIKELIELEELYVQYNNHINDRVLSEICGRCKRLKTLNISYCRHLSTFTPLSWLNNLKNVYMAASTITDEDIDPMIKLGQLEIFHATSCSIGETSVNAMVEHCPNLKELSLNQCDPIRSEAINLLLQKCCNLQSLSLQGADLYSEIFDSLDCTGDSLDNLTVLDLSYCRQFSETGILKLNEFLTQRRLAGDRFPKKITVYAHQTKVTKIVLTLLDPSLLEVLL